MLNFVGTKLLDISALLTHGDFILKTCKFNEV